MTRTRRGPYVLALFVALVCALCAWNAAGQPRDATVDVLDGSREVDAHDTSDALEVWDAGGSFDVVDAHDASDGSDAHDAAIDATRGVPGGADTSPSDAGVASRARGEARGTPAARRSTGSMARVTLGLFVLLALVILGGSSAVRAFERRAGLTMVLGSGLPFLLLGVIARRPEVGILDDDALRDLTPLLEFGLGWIGFRVGADFDVRAMDRWPRGTARVMGAEAACAFLVVVVVMALTLGAGVHPQNAIRNAIILGACAAVSAPTGVRAMEAAGLLPGDRARDLRRVAALDDVVGVLVLGLVTSAFRPVNSGAWVLPPLGWLFLQIGMGVVHGGLLVGATRVARNAHERFALTLGAVAFSAGMAGYVGFSPLVVGAVAGVVVANLPSAAEAGDLLSKARQREFERTIFMVFFVVTGALWNPTNLTGWVLVPAYVIARLAGKLLGLRAARASDAPSATASRPSAPPQVATASVPPRGGVSLRAAWLALMPTSAVSIAIIVSVRTAYVTVLSGALETVVIIGALVAEMVFRVSLFVAGGRSMLDAEAAALPIEHETPDAPGAASAPPAQPPPDDTTERPS
jgi:Kef-type K+ transport system membrane component KefB